MSGWNDLDIRLLAEGVRTIRQAESTLREHVAWLREQGCPWSVIGDALGVSRQAAQQRYGASGDSA